MPTYDYKCESCGETFEYFQSMNDPRLETCILDGCTGKVKRLLGTGAGIIFKGSGFYETDYRSDSYEKAAKKETETTSDSSKSDSKSDGSKKPGAKKKPAAKPKKTESKT